jgi:hypothetical protein
VHPAPGRAKERPRDLQRARQQQQASGVRKPLHDQGGTWIFGSSARMSTSALTLSVSSST